MTLVSLTAYAALHGVKKQSASEWKAQGCLVCDGSLIDVEASDKIMQGVGKGRFRVKGHGGRRKAGERGLIDRPGLSAPVEPGACAAVVVAAPWEAWHPPGNPIMLQDQLREAIEGGDSDELDELLDTVAYNEYEQERIRLGWARWHEAVAPELASALALPTDKVAAVRTVLQRLVDQRMRAIGYAPDELDHSLDPL